MENQMEVLAIYFNKLEVQFAEEHKDKDPALNEGEY